MLVSTKGRYALRVLLVLAQKNPGEYMSLDSIASSEDISEKYLESIVRILVQAKLLEGLRGRGGGYRLTRKPEEYTVGEVLRLTEGSLAPVACLDEGSVSCKRTCTCPTLPMWEKLDQLICEYLDSIHLSDLLDCAAKSDVRKNNL